MEILDQVKEIKGQFQRAQGKKEELLKNYIIVHEKNLKDFEEKFIRTIKAPPNQNQGYLQGFGNQEFNYHLYPPTISFEMTLSKETSRLPIPLKGPWGVAYGSDDTLYISDTDDQVIISLKEYQTNRFPCQLRDEPPYPRGVAVNSQENLVVVLSNLGKVGIYTTDGIRKMTFSSNGIEKDQLSIPRSVAVGPNDQIYVADTENHRIQVFSKDGKHLTSFGRLGQKEGEFMYPIGIAYSNGFIAVTDCDNHRVQIFNSQGIFLSTFGSPGAELGQFNKPNGISFDHYGNIVVCDSENHRIQLFSKDGQYITCYGQKGTKQDELQCPRGLAVSREGQLAIADFANKRVQIVRIEY